MANNRLFIQDTETGDVLMLFKGLPSTGWWAKDGMTMDAVVEWLDGRDFDATNLSDETTLRLVTEGKLIAEGYWWRDGRLVNDSYGEDDPGKPQGEQP